MIATISPLPAISVVDASVPGSSGSASPVTSVDSVGRSHSSSFSSTASAGSPCEAIFYNIPSSLHHMSKFRFQLALIHFTDAFVEMEDIHVEDEENDGQKKEYAVKLEVFRQGTLLTDSTAFHWRLCSSNTSTNSAMKALESGLLPDYFIMNMEDKLDVELQCLQASKYFSLSSSPSKKKNHKRKLDELEAKVNEPVIPMNNIALEEYCFKAKIVPKESLTKFAEGKDAFSSNEVSEVTSKSFVVYPNKMEVLSHTTSVDSSSGNQSFTVQVVDTNGELMKDFPSTTLEVLLLEVSTSKVIRTSQQYDPSSQYYSVINGNGAQQHHVTLQDGSVSFTCHFAKQLFHKLRSKQYYLMIQSLELIASASSPSSRNSHDVHGNKTANRKKAFYHSMTAAVHRLPSACSSLLQVDDTL